MSRLRAFVVSWPRGEFTGAVCLEFSAGAVRARLLADLLELGYVQRSPEGRAGFFRAVRVHRAPQFDGLVYRPGHFVARATVEALYRSTVPVVTP